MFVYIQESHELVEVIKTKSREVIISSDGAAPRQFTPSFTQHVISVTGLTVLTESSSNVTVSQVQNLAASIYIKVSLY